MKSSNLISVKVPSDVKVEEEIAEQLGEIKITVPEPVTIISSTPQLTSPGQLPLPPAPSL